MSSKRKPIDYKAQFAPGVFRPTEEIEGELATLNDVQATSSTDPVTTIDTRRARESADHSEVEGKYVRTNERLSERSNEQTREAVQSPRRRIRHSFDIWEDQLLSLAEIQARLFLITRRKPKLGELVQEALDAYITRHEKANEYPNVRTNGRTIRRG